MKKMYLNTLITFAISCLTASQALAINPILRNNYGKDIEFKTSDNNVKKLSNGQETNFNGNTLFLRANGGQFSDVSIDLRKIFNQINNDEPYRLNETPVITIDPSYFLWKLSLSWR